MTSLASNLRNKLEKVVVDARDIAELGAKEAIEALAVHHHEPYGHMSPEQRSLRNSLRAHARQLGDHRDVGGKQKIDHLLTECAYEHWHRMLFARFLAENHLLIEPGSGVAISLEECEEIAKEEKVDTWTLASRYAQQMLPQIFRPDNPLLQVSLPRNHRLSLEKLLDNLDPTVFTASDSLGWVYQFWQSKKKEAVNRSEKKIGADELPAVTQLFTEPYMVAFLLDNSLGAWWAARRLTANDLKNATSEEELRLKASISGVPLEYLRFVRAEDGTWAPAAGSFDAWPEALCDFKALDPCCGSGHFLVALFLMLVPMRMELEHLTAKEAVNAVLRENIHGLELDQRCVELAAFALALAAWCYPGTAGYRPLPDLSLACSGHTISAKREDWLTLAGANTNLRLTLDELHGQFKDASILGSLINPKSGLGKGTLYEVKWEQIDPLLTKALSDEKDVEKSEMSVLARGIAKAARLLVYKYNLVITNVPYLGIRKQQEKLKEYCAKNHEIAKGDIATVFLHKYLRYNIKEGGCYSVVTPSALLNKDYFTELRKYVLENYTICSTAVLGPRAFETITGEVVDVILLSIKNRKPAQKSSLTYIDSTLARNSQEKAESLKKDHPSLLEQKTQLSNPDYRIQLTSYGGSKLLQDYCECPQGIKTGDDEKWIKKFWEISNDGHWVYCQSSSKDSNEFGGLEKVIDWSSGGLGMIRPRLDSPAVGRWAVGLSQTGDKRPVLFVGARFDSNIAPVLPYDSSHLSAIWAFCSSSDFTKQLDENSRGLFTTNTALLQVPFDYAHWQNVGKGKYPHGLPKPYSNDPTQWIFHGHPCGSVIWDETTKRTAHGPLRTDSTVLQVAVARLLGYRWPAELDPGMELADEQREWVKRCEALMPFADDDGIVCVPALRKEDAAVDRLGPLLSAAFGTEWSPAKERDLLTATGSTATTLNEWLRNDFFEQHCKLFGHRPFIWHIWDGRKRDGFHALVNYHKLAEGNGKGRKLLEKLTYGYLGDWINLQKDGIKQGTGGAEDRLAAALELEKRLKAILDGEPPFDIFVRWKPIEEQPIGWEPDINDGVRLNIRPFMASDIPGGRTGAGILRWSSNVKWDKDRGKDVESAPWYTAFKGERINDHHLTNAEKMAARTKAGKGGTS